MAMLARVPLWIGACGVTLAVGLSEMGCGASSSETPPKPPEAVRVAFDARRHIPEDLPIVVYIDVEAMAIGAYGTYVRRLVEETPLFSEDAKAAIEDCRKAWIGLDGGNPNSENRQELVVGIGDCAARASERLAGWTVDKHGADAFTAKTSASFGAAGAPTPARQSTPFSVEGKVLALRLRQPLIHDIGSSARELGMIFPSVLGEARVFFRAEPTFSLWLENDFPSEAQAAAYEAQWPAILRELESNQTLRVLALDKGVHRASASHRKNTALLAISLLPDDARQWVATVDQAATEWIESGGHQTVDEQIGQRSMLSSMGRSRELRGAVRAPKQRGPRSVTTRSR